jgi:hypothetical protein
LIHSDTVQKQVHRLDFLGDALLGHVSAIEERQRSARQARPTLGLALQRLTDTITIAIRDDGKKPSFCAEVSIALL